MMRYLSLFSGMEAASLAWGKLGWQCAAVAEIDPSACALLAHRFPEVPNLGSVTDITDDRIAALGHVDVVIGGSPCQDLSVAGKRAGLTGARSGLFHEQLRIFHAARAFCGARWLVWENVPGAFSSHAGRDFALVVGAMAGCELDVPADGWGTEGLALGENGLVEWCVLDAQWFGVAQRRRRVFAVLDTGDWASRPPVLLEPEGMRGDSPPRREAGEATAGTLATRAGSGSGPGMRAESDGGAGLIHCPPIVPQAISSKWAKGSSGPAGDEVANLVAVDLRNGTLGDVGMTVQAAGMGDARGSAPNALPHVLARFDDVAHNLRADGFDASSPQAQAVAFSCKDHGADASDIAPTLRSMGHDGSHANGGGQVAVAFAQNQRDEVRTMEVAGALAAEPGMKQQTYLQTGMQVRRLTPRECERLQGAPDDWTLVPNAKGKPMADGPRYKMIGNSFAVPCIWWIGSRIKAAMA